MIVTSCNAVSADGFVLDAPVQSRRDRRAAQKLVPKLPVMSPQMSNTIRESAQHPLVNPVISA